MNRMLVAQQAHCICSIGADEYRVSSFGSLLSFCSSLIFTIKLLNKFLSLVTTFSCRRRGRRIDEVPNSTNARTLAAIKQLDMHKPSFLSIFALILTLNCIAQVHVSGYYRKNGTYVQPHYRSNPDGNPYNNWSYPGNVNPYTGKVAPGNADTYLDNYYNRNSTSQSHSNNTPTYYPST